MHKDTSMYEFVLLSFNHVVMQLCLGLQEMTLLCR